jgi:hypothetical protein
MKSLLCFAAMVCCGLLTSTNAYADLIGSTVTATLYNPNLSAILGGPTTRTVGASTPTFPSGSIVGNTAFEIDITVNTSSVAILDVDLQTSTVPEPTSYVPLLTVLAVLGGTKVSRNIGSARLRKSVQVGER